MDSTFTDFIETIFGPYQPIVTYDNGVVVDVSTNWGYIASVLILGIAFLYLLKTIGGVIFEWLRR